MTYHSNGSVATRSGNTYQYGQGGTHPHAVTGVTGPGATTFWYDANGNVSCRGAASAACTGGKAIEWTVANQPSKIYFAGGDSFFTYGPDRQRVRQVLTQVGQDPLTTDYVTPSFEVEHQGGVTRSKTHVYFGDRLVFMQRDDAQGSQSLGTQAYFVHQDLMGSIDRLTDAGGNLAGATAYSFAAFGGRRSASSWAEGGEYGAAHWTERGYTGHEHLDASRLIHMNGRVQDPNLARMLSPDPVQGDLTDPQSLNPYSYVRNSPFRFTDPTGFFDAESIFGRWDCGPGCTVAWDASWERGRYAVWEDRGTLTYADGRTESLGSAYYVDFGSGDHLLLGWWDAASSGGTWGRTEDSGFKMEPDNFRNAGPDPGLVPGLPLAICIFDGTCDGGEWRDAALQAALSVAAPGAKPILVGIKGKTVDATRFALDSLGSPKVRAHMAARTLEILAQSEEAAAIATGNARIANMLRGVPQSSPEVSIPLPAFPRSSHIQLPP